MAVRNFMVQQSNQTKFVILLFLAILFSFWPTFQAGFLDYDDLAFAQHELVSNPLSLNNIGRIFTSKVISGYTPLTLLSFNIEHQLFGFNPFVFHFTNLILHFLVVFLIFRFAQQMKLSETQAFLAALLFAIHPMHVESVAWITERKDVLYATFYMLALCQYVKYLDTKDKNTYRWTYVWGLLSMLAKPMAVSLPFIFLLIDYTLGRKITKEVIAEKLPHLIYITALASLELSHAAKTPLSSVPQAILICLWSLSFYIPKFFIPTTYTPFYEIPQPITFSNPHFMLSLAICFMIPILVWKFRHNREWIFAWLFYLISVGVVLKFSLGATNIVADRYMYLPSLGICFWLGSLINNTHKRLTPQKGAATLWMIFIVSVFVFLSVKTHRQCQVWQSRLNFWSHVITHSPTHQEAYNSRGSFYSTKGMFPQAHTDFNTAIMLNSTFAKPFYNKGLAYEREGETVKALEFYNKAIALNPDYSSALNNRGAIYMESGQFHKAKSDFEAAIKSDPQNQASIDNLQKIQRFLNR